MWHSQSASRASILPHPGNQILTNPSHPFLHPCSRSSGTGPKRSKTFSFSLYLSAMGCGGSKLLRSNRVSSSFSRKISPLPEQASGNEASVEDHSRERTDHEDENHDTSPSLCKIKKDPRVESLKRQLRQLAEELARFEAWCLEEGESSSSKEERENEERDVPLLERDKDSLDQFEDFTSKVPVYDEDPSDLLQVCFDKISLFSLVFLMCLPLKEKPISPLSIESGGSDKAEFDQTL